MNTQENQQVYYVLDKQRGETSSALSWSELELGLDRGIWTSDCPVTQAGASGWSTLAELMAAGQGACIKDLLVSTAKGQGGILSKIWAKLKGNAKGGQA